MVCLAVLLIAFVALYLYGANTFTYWENRGIKHDKPLPFFGNNLCKYLMKKSVTQIASDMYWKYPNEKIVGFYRANRPELVIRDPGLVKRILLTDFDKFYARGINYHKTVYEPLLRNLFFADGDLWKLLRKLMTSGFTKAKIKAIFPTIADRAECLKKIINASHGQVLDAREIMARYSTDVIVAYSFGIDANSLQDNDSIFRKLGAASFKLGRTQHFIRMLKEVFPETCKHLKLLVNVEESVNEIVKSILNKRKCKSSDRNDFIDLLLKCKKNGKMVGESIETTTADGSPAEVCIELDDLLLTAQVFVLFGAGFETSSSATSFTLHLLAYHQEIQKEVQEEIVRVLSKYNNKISYDAIQEMTYLGCVLKESLRLFPPIGFLMRRCAREYTFPELNLTIDERVAIVIPLQAMHMDPNYFKNPEKFFPERFFSCNVGHKTRHVYLPFGEGPRACIGERLGMMQSLAGLASVLSRYTVEPAPDTTRYPDIDPTSNLVQRTKGGLPLLFRLRTTILE